MPLETTIDFSGPTFIPQVLSNQAFRDQGYLLGTSSTRSSLYYAVVNPRKHRLYSWKKDWFLLPWKVLYPYEYSARELRPIVFTNGPQMGLGGGT